MIMLTDYLYVYYKFKLKVKVLKMVFVNLQMARRLQGEEEEIRADLQELETNHASDDSDSFLCPLGRFEPISLLFWGFQSALVFKFAASVIMNN